MKKITFNYDDTQYNLRFTKRTVQQMEQAGFNIQEIDSKMATTLPLLFAGAFKAEQPFLKQGKIDEIYETLPNKEDLIIALVELYNDTMQGLLVEPDAKKGNVTEWKMTE